MHYYLGCTSDKIWNYTSLIEFLVNNQEKDIVIELQPEAICVHNLGLYKILDLFQFSKVTILTNNPLENHPKYEIVHKPFDIWFNKQDIDVNLHQWNRIKKFYCLFGRPTAGRLGLGSYINKHYSKDAHIHFSFSTSNDTLHHYELDKLLTYRVESIDDVGNIVSKFPITLSSTEKYTAFDGYDYTDPLTKFYKDIFVDIVVESHVSGKTFFPTEKTLRPMWLKKPFIMFASKDYLCYLRQMGFRTFSDFWDEDYDGYEGRGRFSKILKLIDSIAGKSYEELEEMYWDMQYTLDYNYNVLKNRNWSTNITEVI